MSPIQGKSEIQISNIEIRSATLAEKHGGSFIILPFGLLVIALQISLTPFVAQRLMAGEDKPVSFFAVIIVVSIREKGLLWWYHREFQTSIFDIRYSTSFLNP